MYLQKRYQMEYSTENIDNDQMPIIFDQFHNEKKALHRGIYETIRWFKENY